MHWGSERAALLPIAEGFAMYQVCQHTIVDAQGMLDDEDMVAFAKEEIKAAEIQSDQLLEQLAARLVTAEDASIGACMLEVRAGTGGDEAALFAGEVLDAYQTFAKTKGWQFEVLDFSPGNVGGLRHAVIGLRGAGVWQALGYESGVHCVKRVPTTETQGRIQTSTCTLAVLPEPEQVDAVLDCAEVDEHITTAQGPGGQNVNKVATAVHLIHKPTGIEVRMQESKSQQMNKDKAWRLLAVRVHDHFQAQKRCGTRGKTCRYDWFRCTV